MFSLLTKYLLHFKKVAIPHIGGLQLIAEPAALNIADKVIHPPVYTVQFADEADADPHQIHYIAAASEKDERTVSNQLNNFGAALRRRIQQQPFTWNGIGQWQYENGVILFSSDTIALPSLQAIEAHRVLRDHTTHTVLIGDLEVQAHTSRDRAIIVDDRKAALPAKKYTIIIGLIIAAIALAFIGYYLYANNFQPSASGYQQKINPAAPAPTYH